MLSITLKQLEIFVTVAETANFSRAGIQLSFAQSTISTNIQELEEAVGAKLLDRSNKKSISLTDDGREFYAYAKGILSSCYALQHGIRGNQQEDSIAVGASTIPARYILPDMMALYRGRHDTVRFQLKEGSTNDLLSMLTLRKIDLGLSIQKIPQPEFRCQMLYRDPIVLALPGFPHYQKVINTGTTIKTILETEPIVWNPDVAEQVDSFLPSVGLSRNQLHIVAEMDSETLAKRAVVEGIGSAFLSALSLKCVLNTREVDILPVDSTDMFRSIYLVSRKTPVPEQRVRDFADFLTSQTHVFNQCNHGQNDLV